MGEGNEGEGNEIWERGRRRKGKAAWSVSPWRSLPLSLGASQGLASPGRPSTGDACGPACWHMNLSSARFPSCALCLWGQGPEGGHGPWGSASRLPAPRAELRSQSQCNDPVHSSERKGGYGSGAARHTQAHLPEWAGRAWDRKGSGSVSRQRSPCREENAPRGSCSGPRSCSQSGHVAGDGAEGIEQGGLHARLQEQQVHMDLL